MHSTAKRFGIPGLPGAGTGGGAGVGTELSVPVCAVKAQAGWHCQGLLLAEQVLGRPCTLCSPQPSHLGLCIPLLTPASPSLSPRFPSKPWHLLTRRPLCCGPTPGVGAKLCLGRRKGWQRMPPPGFVLTVTGIPKGMAAHGLAAGDIGQGIPPGQLRILETKQQSFVY